MISAWTIRTEVEENDTRGEGILERSPLAQYYSLSGRTIWLALTAISLFVLYIADRIINPNETSEDATEADDLSGRSLANPSSTDRSSTNPGSKSTGCIADSEAALLRQLFPDTQEKGIFSSSRRDQVLLRFYTHNKKAKITPSPCRTPPNQSNKATPSNVARLTMTPFHNDARWGEPPSAPSWISGTVHFGLIG
jgi:hypothetical protein